MATLGENKPNAPLTNLRILILKELERTDLSDEHRVRLLEKAADLQLLAAKKWQKRYRQIRAYREKGPGQGVGGGRKKRTHDSDGEPLYNGIAPLPKPGEPEPEDPKKKFLSTLRTNESATVEDTSS
jgi:hypothetical protein